MKKFIVLVLAVIAAVMLLSVTVSANSAEPPIFRIVCVNEPEDLKMYAEYKNSETGEEVSNELDKDSAVEYSGSYSFLSHGSTFFLRGWNSSFENGLTIKAVSSEKTLYFTLKPDNSYNNYYTFDYGAETITEGKPAAPEYPKTRRYLLIALRLSLTLIIEGLVFLAFGYRKLKSWIIFLITNLITQGALNLLLSLIMSYEASADAVLGYIIYVVIIYVIAEPIIFGTEMLVFGLSLKEHKGGRGVGCAAVANLASLVLGGIIIALLPV